MEQVLAYAIWVHKNTTPKNWLMRVKGLNEYIYCTFRGTLSAMKTASAYYC